jgi:hypothetical protein
MLKKQGTEKLQLYPLPGEEHPDYFAILVRNCITAYEKLPNDRMALDYCKVTGKLRAMVLGNETYIKETRNTSARHRLEELEELEYLKSIAAGEDGDEGYEHDPRRRGTGKKTNIDRDILNMRFKAAQLKRELLSEISKEAGDTEKDAVNVFFVGMTREEFHRLETVEVNQGSNDASLDELIAAKEEAPEGSMRPRGQARTESVVFETVNEDGSIEEL